MQQLLQEFNNPNHVRMSSFTHSWILFIHEYNLNIVQDNLWEP